MSALHVLVSGNVQGVFFRANTRDLATSLGLAGWVRNLPDGRVEVFAQGSDQDLAELREWLQTGPSRADVNRVETEEAGEDPSLEGFEIR